MDIQYKIPWSELLWQGIAEGTGEFVIGQLFRIKDNYYINRPYRQGYYQNNGDDDSIVTISDWYKIVPSTLERVECEVVTEEEEQRYLRSKTSFEEELKEYIEDLCETKNIPIDLRFACLGDVNKFCTNNIEFSVNCVSYYTKDFEDIKSFFKHYLDIIWSNRQRSINRMALYIKNIVDMDSWYEVIVGDCLFEDDSLI